MDAPVQLIQMTDVCPNCDEEVYSVCDNDCGTFTCEECCLDFYYDAQGELV